MSMSDTLFKIRAMKRSLTEMEERIENDEAELRAMSPEDVRSFFENYVPKRDVLWFVLCKDLGIR